MIAQTKTANQQIFDFGQIGPLQNQRYNSHFDVVNQAAQVFLERNPQQPAAKIVNRYLSGAG